MNAFEKGFWDKVDKTGECWIYTGYITREGYGRHAGMLAHKLSWLLTHDEPVPEHICVCHECDNRPCVRPKHLWLGTRKQNTEDRDRKGRQARGDTHGSKTFRGHTATGGRNGSHTAPTSRRVGTRNGRAKITQDQADAIRLEYARGGVSQKKLGIRYGITDVSISLIVRNKSWTPGEGACP